MTPLERYKKFIDDIIQYDSESSEAEALREGIDGVWDELTDAEQDIIRSYSIAAKKNSKYWNS